MIYPERHRLLPQKYIKFLIILFTFTIYLYIAAFHVSFPQNQGLMKTFVMSKRMYHYTSASCEQEANAMHMAMALANKNVLLIIVVF